MQEKTFKAATIATPDSVSRSVLEEVFNQWSEDTRPASILHVHYYHDQDAHARGYQVVYEEPWMPHLDPEIFKEDETAHLLV